MHLELLGNAGNSPDAQDGGHLASQGRGAFLDARSRRCAVDLRTPGNPLRIFEADSLDNRGLESSSSSQWIRRSCGRHTSPTKYPSVPKSTAVLTRSALLTVARYPDEPRNRMRSTHLLALIFPFGWPVRTLPCLSQPSVPLAECLQGALRPFVNISNPQPWSASTSMPQETAWPGEFCRMRFFAGSNTTPHALMGKTMVLDGSATHGHPRAIVEATYVYAHSSRSALCAQNRVSASFR